MFNIPDIIEVETLEKRAGHATSGFYYTGEQCTIFVGTMLMSVAVYLPLGFIMMAIVVGRFQSGQTLAGFATAAGFIALGLAAFALILSGQRRARISACKHILNLQ